jgi:hypothetical protein
MSDTDLPPLPSLLLGPYVHYKGLPYEVLGVPRNANGEAIRKAKRGRIHTFLSTSPSHRDHILHASQEDILEACFLIWWRR